MEFAYNNSYQTTIAMALYEMLYGKKCHSPLYWDEIGERRLAGPELVVEAIGAIERIRKHMLIAQSRQQSYANAKRWDIEFEVGHKVFWKVSPTKGVKRFGKKEKLSPRYVGPFEIIERIGPVAYCLALPPALANTHNVFHTSMLRKYVCDQSHTLSYEPLELQPDLSYEVKPVKILERGIKELRTKKIPLVKVLWSNNAVEEATWELEGDTREKYPEIFGLNFEDEILLRKGVGNGGCRAWLCWSRVEVGGGDGGSSGGRSCEHGGIGSEFVATMVRNLGSSGHE
ncbi:uncharacterized protein LOC133799486 [Humulus lupulus]|uniref:uncharacterized protein LOC133799486 n=1 Tax=Humulus lupulus TaxID=3486 RepID=UPI002B402539|nr:uncharacterized protein LOC133799486 [Humulus lupulus]